MKTAIFGLVMAVGVLASFSSTGYASKTELACSELAMITAPDASQSRLLVKYDLPELPEGHEVYYADMTFSMPNLHATQEIELFELGTAWTAANAGWQGPWTSPGGDIRGERKSYWITDETTGGLVKFVLTKSVSVLMSGSETNHGFVIVTTGADPQRLVLPAENPILRIYSGPRFSQ